MKPSYTSFFRESFTIIAGLGIILSSCGENGRQDSLQPSLPTEKPTTLGIKEPLTVDILWTAYYIAPLSKAPDDDGRSINFTDLRGKKFRYSITGKSFHRSEMEAVAVGEDKTGKKRFGYRVDEGVWRELPKGSMGMGNKMNPLVPLVHVAAHQSSYPYGSMIHVKEAEGLEFIPGKTMTGYFWVADTGGRIKGHHFDLFVGEEEVYSGFIDIVKHQHHTTSIYPLPKLEKSWNPHNDGGLQRILESGRYIDKGQSPSKEQLRDALVAFQKDQPYIPAPEYGDPDAATTLWFLTQAALKAKAEEVKTSE